MSSGRIVGGFTSVAWTTVNWSWSGNQRGNRAWQSDATAFLFANGADAERLELDRRADDENFFRRRRRSRSASPIFVLSGYKWP